MDKDLRFIWFIGVLFGATSIILDLIFDFDFSSTELFLACAFIAVAFDYMLQIKKNKNPFQKAHCRRMAFFTIIMTFILFVGAMTQNNIIGIFVTAIMFLLVGMIIAFEFILRHRLYLHMMHYDELKNYADKVRELKALKN